MSNFTQNTVVPIPTEEVPSWVKGDQVALYTNVILATVVNYDASEFPAKFDSEWV